MLQKTGFNRITKEAKITKTKELDQIKIIYTAKETQTIIKRHSAKWKEMFAHNISRETCNIQDLYSTHKTEQEKIFNVPNKKWGEETLPKEECRWPTGIRKYSH